jgi:hypothetical protein
MRDDLTIIYYTSNTELPKFEAKIRRTLVHMSGGLPIVSVSQKPIDFGKNICVGEVGVTGHNALRQMLIGARAATTRFVCMAESDFLHPKDYFTFVPPRDDVFYMAMPLYVLFAQRGKTRLFCPKPQGSEAAMVINREYLIEKMEEMFYGKQEWAREEVRDNLKTLWKHGTREYFYPKDPVITFKTDANMHRKTPFRRGRCVSELPGAGSAERLIRKYL